MKIKEIVKQLEDYAPLSLQESYDNTGLIIGEADRDVSQALICLDITDEVLDEAIKMAKGIIQSPEYVVTRRHHLHQGWDDRPMSH